MRQSRKCEKFLLNCSFCIISQEQGNYKKKVEQPKIELQSTKFINEYSKLLIFREIGWHGNCEWPIPQVMHLMAENEQSLSHKYVQTYLFTVKNYTRLTSSNFSNTSK